MVQCWLTQVLTASIMSLKAGFESQTNRASEICPRASEQMSFESPPGLSRTFRSPRTPRLIVPRMFTGLVKSAFSVAAPTMCNSLTSDERCRVCSISSKKHLKTYLYHCAYASRKFVTASQAPLNLLNHGATWSPYCTVLYCQ